MTPVFRNNDRGDTVLAAYAYEFERRQSMSVEDEEISWPERALVVYSPSHAAPQSQGLEQRLATAPEPLAALLSFPDFTRKAVNKKPTNQLPNGFGRFFPV